MPSFDGPDGSPPRSHVLSGLEKVPGFEWKEQPGERVLLLPDPIGAVPADERFGAVVYERLRAARRAGAGPGANRDPLGGLPGPGARPAALRVPAVLNASKLEPGVLRGSSSPVPYDQPWAFTFGYGEVEFTVDLAWWLHWVQGEGVSSRADVLDVVWDDWHAAIRASGAEWGDLHNSIGCYNLSTDPAADGWLFWEAGWGAPHQFHLYALQMLIVYNSSLRDRESQHPCGAGKAFAEFIDDLLTTQTGRRSEYLTGNDDLRGELVENFRIHFLSRDQRYGGEVEGQECFSSAFPDDEDNDGKCGLKYDEWELATAKGRVGEFWYGNAIGGHADDGNPSHYAPSDPTHFEARNGAPASDCPGGAGTPSSTADRIRMQPHMLNFYGTVSDHVMWLASIAHDYWLHTGDTAYLGHARALGRHVLNQMLYHSGHIAHEMGHVFCGGGHCADNHCFMNHARYRFVCSVRGKLGLYHDSLDFSADDDGCFAVDDLGCSTNRDDLRFHDYETFATKSWCRDAASTTFDWTADEDDPVGGYYTASCGSSQLMQCGIRSYGSPTLGGTSDFVLGTAMASTFCMTRCTAARQTGWAGNCGDVSVDGKVTTFLADGEEATWHVCGP